MLLKIGLFIALLALPFLCFHCVGAHSEPIEGSIRQHVSDSLEASSLTGIAVGVDGRDIALTGTVASQDLKQKAGDLALSADGVRTVDNRLLIHSEPQLSSGADAKTVQANINKILFDKKIEFATSRDALLPVSIPVLEEVLKELGNAPQLNIKIEGHTDSLGDPQANQELSDARAHAVVAWFASHGIAQDRMTAAGFGSSKPISPNTTSAGRYANRRVEITVR